MKLGGAFEVPAPSRKIWRLVTDPKQISKAIPDLKKLVVKSDKNFEAEFKVKVGVLSGTMKVDFRYVDLREPSHVSLSGKGSGMQSTIDIKIDLDIVEKGESLSEVKWASDVILGGIATSLGARIVEDVARSKVEALVKNLKKIASAA
ncbi:MAG: carbon monoxide dehydrogenase subunit G [Nitrososphaerota archaeon]|nr:carbon monoxide dehydrogenase subunit G [Candidatus Calditenuaceae archaeon]MDW8073357.1 carbon monoxide dehydrogenase subunit G [Nitrososphaerota archaeon]